MEAARHIIFECALFSLYFNTNGWKWLCDFSLSFFHIFFLALNLSKNLEKNISFAPTVVTAVGFL